MITGPVKQFTFGDLNPLSWAGKAVDSAASSVINAVMDAIWDGATWLQGEIFTFIDLFTTPDLTAPYLMKNLYPYMLWIGVALLGLLAIIQLTIGVITRRAENIAMVLTGIATFGVVTAIFLTVASAIVEGSNTMSQGIMKVMFGGPGFVNVNLHMSQNASNLSLDNSVIMAIIAILVIIPASIGYALIMLTREGSIYILVATIPIAAAGAVAKFGVNWIWKTFRWFLAACFISPLLAIVLGIANQISLAANQAMGTATGISSASQDAGLALVSATLYAMALVAPMSIYKILSFVEPGTTSGANLRSSLKGLDGPGNLFGGKGGSGSGSTPSSDGNSNGEAAAQSQDSNAISSAKSPSGSDVGGAGKSGGGASGGAAAGAKEGALAGPEAAAIGAAIGAAKQGLQKAGQSANDTLSSAGVGHNTGHPGASEDQKDNQSQNTGNNDEAGDPPLDDDYTPPTPPDPSSNGGDDRPPPLGPDDDDDDDDRDGSGAKDPEKVV